MSAPNHISEVIEQAIDETLAGLVGDVTRDLVYHRIKTELDLTPAQMVADPRKVNHALELIFGRVAETVRRAILRKVASRYRISLREIHGKTFAEYVEDLRKRVGSKPPY